MSNIDKQALRQKAVKAGGEEWQSRKMPGPAGEYTVIVKGSLEKHPGWTTCRPVADEVIDKKTMDFIAAANPATMLALLDENIQLHREKDAIEAVALALRDDMRQAREQLEAAERRKADNQEPAGYHVIKECGKVGCSVATLEEAEKTRDFWSKKWTIRPYFYTAPPVQETGVYKDMLNIIGLLENNEWAEHCTSTVLGSLLESEITRLVGKEQPAPVVPEDISGIIERFQYQADHLSDWRHIDEHSCKVNRRDLMTALEFMDSCRAAMLNGGKS
ncbi:TPA: ead/Ea22-like family protein [Salmonella enterica subsp. enterica serovar Heidelberg]